MRRIFILMWTVLMLFALSEYALGLTEYAWVRGATWPQAVGFSALTAALIAGLVFIVGRWARIVFISMTLYLAITAAVEGFLKINFFDRGLYGEAMMVTLINTSWAEIDEFVRNYLTAKTLLYGAVGLLVVLPTLAGLVFIPIQKPTVKMMLFFAVLEILGLHFVLHDMSYDKVLPALLEHEFLHQGPSWGVYRDLKEAGQKLQTNDWLTANTNRLVVIAIGESSSRTHWSLYGYARETNPRLQAKANELIIFSNCVATAYLTPFALRDTLTFPKQKRRLSIPAVTAAAGYDSILLSAQGRWGIFDGADELLFKSCRERIYLCEQSQPPHYDAGLLPFLMLETQRNQSKQSVFLHFYGSHVDWKQRYPTSFAKFSTNTNDEIVRTLTPQLQERVNAYDNTIVYTDHVLAECIALLKNAKRPTIFVYFSDHGETPLSSNRDANQPEIFEIPFFIWASPEMRAADPNLFARLTSWTSRKITSHDISPILLDLLGISHRH